jgi:hypothetical protein
MPLVEVIASGAAEDAKRADDQIRPLCHLRERAADAQRAIEDEEDREVR